MRRWRAVIVSMGGRVASGRPEDKHVFGFVRSRVDVERLFVHTEPMDRTHVLRRPRRTAAARRAAGAGVAVALVVGLWVGVLWTARTCASGGDAPTRSRGSWRPAGAVVRMVRPGDTL